MYHVALIHAVILALVLSAFVRLSRKWSTKLFIAVACCLVALVIPLARSSYHQCIDERIQPLLDNIDQDQDGDSKPMCEAAELASNHRQQCIASTRESYPIADVISVLFDTGRGVDQSKKTFGLFRQKLPCVDILHKSTHSNFNVNLFAIIITVVSMVLTAVCIITTPSEGGKASKDT
eukprot:TRINITY_DN1422_c0_g1_i1.p1 TRINITY_DN1422_c0_g1~~TRINITY_DN1422_c0_g1_i1.p1  ORF type:complete len:178 (+),score=21.07 TRINITY_DN1422_c0_g1_i1:402-935(+)